MAAWGGLRGAVGLVLGLLVHMDTKIEKQVQDVAIYRLSAGYV